MSDKDIDQLVPLLQNIDDGYVLLIHNCARFESLEYIDECLALLHQTQA
jgi:hypothetical protein